MLHDLDSNLVERCPDLLVVLDAELKVVRASAGPAEEPAMTATTDAATFVEIGGGRLTPLAAMVSGKLDLDGEIDAVLRCCSLLGLEAGPIRAVEAQAV